MVVKSGGDQHRNKDSFLQESAQRLAFNARHIVEVDDIFEGIIVSLRSKYSTSRLQGLKGLISLVARTPPALKDHFIERCIPNSSPHSDGKAVEVTAILINIASSTKSPSFFLPRTLALRALEGLCLCSPLFQVEFRAHNGFEMAMTVLDGIPTTPLSSEETAFVNAALNLLAAVLFDHAPNHITFGKMGGFTAVSEILLDTDFPSPLRAACLHFIVILVSFQRVRVLSNKVQQHIQNVIDHYHTGGRGLSISQLVERVQCMGRKKSVAKKGIDATPNANTNGENDSNHGEKNVNNTSLRWEEDGGVLLQDICQGVLENEPALFHHRKQVTKANKKSAT
eukprot:Nk52_evm35s554 gene=Nk52_evmTU35s554